MDVHIQTEINAPAGKVWEILAHHFADIAIWSSTVSASHAVEAADLPQNYRADPDAPVAGRSTTTPLATMIEVITRYSEANRELTFAAAGLPSLLAEARDTQRVIAQSPDRCIVTFDIHVESRGIFKLFNPIVQRRFKTMMTVVQQDLKRYAETGQIEKP